MRILVLNYEYPPLGGGAAPVCKHLSRHFARAGHQVDVVTMAYRDLPSEEVQDGVRIMRVPALRKRMETCETPEMLSYVMSAFPRVTARLMRGQYDVIHCHFIIPTGLLAWSATRLGRTPYVITAHGSDVPGFNPERFTKEHHITGPLLRTIARGAASVVAPSEFLRGLIRESIGAGDVELVPNGIDVDSLGFGSKKRHLLMTGRLLKRKGFQHVLEALEGVDTDFEIHIAGDGPLRAELEAMAAKIPAKVVFHGWLENGSREIGELYESAAIFCLPSQRENASIALLEGMLSGAAVITSNDTGCAETIGDAGLTVVHGDVPALRQALLPLMRSEALCAEYGAKARQRVLDCYSWDRISARYLELLERAAGGS
ncbi:MAG: glycosyltransferase family 4 protein [Candidatus Hydrogenedentes bacterium]|nr:glycosyltransferase family 4 protein [Candidatus Hydrogenedentota bacterium]